MANKVTENKQTTTNQPASSSKAINFKDINLLLPLGGAALAFVGSFLAWASINVFFFKANVAGIDGDGKITAALSGLLLLLVILSKTVWRAKQKLTNQLNYGLLALALAVFGVFVYDATQLLSVDDYGMIKVGFGLYMVGAGAALALISPAKDLLKLKKQFGYIALGVIAAVTAGMIVLGIVNKEGFNGGDSLDSDSASSSSSSTDSSDWLSGWPNSSTTTESLEITVLSRAVKMSDTDSDYGYVQGEIKNNNSSDAYISGVTTSLYLDGTLVATEDAYDYPTMLKAGETGAYKAYISNFPADYDEVQVTAEATNASSWQTCEKLDVLSQTPRESDYNWGYGSFDVAGEVENNTTTNYTSANVYVWLTDANDQVIDLTSAYIDEINSGGTQPYEASFSFTASPSYTAIKVLAIGCH
jgi:hypothetical protein